MKKIITVIILMLSVTLVYSQQTNVDKNLTVELPAGFVKQNNQQLKAYLTTRNSKRIIKSDSFTGLTYKLGDIVFKLMQTKLLKTPTILKS